MGGPSTPSTQYVKQETSNLPEYARPYYEGLLERAQPLLRQDYQPYQTAEGQPIERIAGFTPQQQQVQQNILAQQTPQQFGTATGLTTAAGLGSLAAANYNPNQFRAQQVRGPQLNQYQMGPAMGVEGQQYAAPQMDAAQTGYSPELSSFQSGYRPDLTAFQMGPTREVSAQQVSAPEMQAARTTYGQQPLEQMRMAAPETFGAEQAQKYMSPYIQQALEPQRREAIRSAQQAQLAQDLGAARQGTYGGSRQLLAATERERNLQQQLGDIEARGMQSAYESAQTQFERDRAAGMTAGQQNLQAGLQQQQLQTQTGLQTALANLSNEQQAAVNNQATQFQAQGMNAQQAMQAALANQGVDVTRAQQNLASQLGVQELGAQQGLQTSLANQQAALQAQQLGTQTGLQTSLANLSSQQQANVQNQAAILQTQGLNADQALRAALANQQAGLQVGQQNLQSLLQTQQLGAQQGMQAQLANQQYGLEAQRLAEQSRQFGAQQGLAGLAQAGQMGQTLSNIGTAQQQSDIARLNQQQQTAAQEQALQQERMTQQYQDFLRQQGYPLEMLQQYSSLLRGVPVTPSSTTTYAAPGPSTASQIMSAGLGGLSMARMAGAV